MFHRIESEVYLLLFSRYTNGLRNSSETQDNFKQDYFSNVPQTMAAWAGKSAHLRGQWDVMQGSNEWLARSRGAAGSFYTSFTVKVIVIVLLGTGTKAALLSSRNNFSVCIHDCQE